MVFSLRRWSPTGEELIEPKNAVALHFSEAVLAEVILESLLGLLGELLQVLVDQNGPIHTLALPGPPVCGLAPDNPARFFRNN